MIHSRVRGVLTHDLVRRSGLFGISIVASTLVGLVSIPLINAMVGKDEWGQLWLLQTIAQFASILIAFGWGATGPATVAGLPAAERRQFLFDSLLVRVPLLCVIAPLAVGLAALIGAEPIAAMFAVVAYGVPGIGAAWYFVGINRPLWLFVWDALPAIIGQIAGLIAVVLWPSIRSYLAAVAIFTTLGVVAGLWVSLRRIGDDRRLRRPRASTVLPEMRTQSHGLIALLFGNLATMLPGVLLQIFAKEWVATFGLIDKFYRYGIIVLGALLQAMQSWVGENRALLRERARVLFWFSLGTGLVGGGLYALLAPQISLPFSSGQISISWGLGALGALAFGSECVAQLVGLAGLIAVGRGRVLSATAVVSAIFTIVLVVPATWAFGITGALWVVAVPILGMAVIRSIVLWGEAAPQSVAEDDVPGD